MPSKSGMSKAFAVAFVVLTVSVIAGTVTMFILYEIQMHGVNATAQPTFPATTEPPPPVLRLGKSVVPVRYSLSLRVGLYTRIIQEVNVTSPNQTLSFSGNSTVHFRCAQRTNSIFLHGLDLLVSDPQVKHTDTGRTVGSSLKKPDKKSRFLEVGLKDFMEVGEHYSLTLSFEGELSENLEALYVSQYREEDLEYEEFLAATYLEPTGARKMFPCFDEPEMKAEFDVKIIHRRDTTALNPHFLLTPKMSTYLLAFTVSEFRSVSLHVLQTFARPEAIAAGHTAYASEITRKILEFYERRFQIEYELNKLDQIALPDLDPAAMENWGLVTYQEGHLLYEEGVSSMLHKEVIAVMIAHELAHQWFGNLVTMKWWNNIWLNEGFATYMSYFAVDDVEPSFKMEDALASSHPLILAEQDVETPDAISGLFDAITYSKGALLLRMLADIVGESTFNEGINVRLNIDRLVHRWQGRHFKFGQSVENLMAPWTKQAGYPVITIDTTNGEIYQKRFLFSDTAESRYTKPYHFPYKSELVWLTESGPVRKEEFISKDSEWILANVNSFGYYRVNYNLENWQRLLHQLETKPHLIPLMNRGQLVDDAFNLARAKLVDVTLALNSTRFLRHETEFLPWESALRNLEYFVLMFDRSEVYGPMQAYLREQVRGLYDFYRTDTENSSVPVGHSEQHNQINAVMLACANGLPECIEMATYKFAEWMEPNGTNTIHPNLRSVIYCQAVAAGGRAEWEFAWDKLQSSSDTSEKEQLRGALACTKKIWLLNRYLQYTLDPDKIRLMDVASIITDVATNSAGQALAWNFMRAHWDYVSQGDASLLIQGVTSRFSTPFELEELERFADVYELGSGVRAAQQAIEQTRVNIEWVNNNKDAVLQWFEAHTEEERYH
uniref:Aminopeptidase n=1 Tax=Stegastes partitus TaxID=144197 RepID=A0A3B4ZIV6_9TELE